MKRIAFIFRTDVHVADKSPVSWKGDYPAEIWSNLEQIGQLAREHDVAAVLDGGDYFHVKASTRNTHALVRRTADLHAGYPCPTHLVVGNHDIAYNNLDTLERQPLGVLFSTGVFQRLGPVQALFEAPGPGGALHVRVVGAPYDPNRTLEQLRDIKKEPTDSFLIAVVHQLAGKNPPANIEEFYGEPVFRYEDLVYEGGPDVWCFGHWHKDQGIEVIDGRYFVNLGAVSRGALVKENLERNPKVALIEATQEESEPKKIKVTPIRLKVAPAADQFDLERKEQRDQESQAIDQFVDRLTEEALVDTTEGVETTVASLDFAPEVRRVATEYLERARGE